MSDPVKHRHIIGCCRSIPTAVLVCEYLRERCAIRCKINPDSIAYVFKEPTEANGWWLADIVVNSYSLDVPNLESSGILVDACRAFVAGRGEVWA